MGDTSQKPLVPRMAAFVREYLVDLNATAAAVRAGYGERNAKVRAAKLLRQPRVKAAVDAALAERAKRCEVKADDVLMALVRVVKADIRRAYDAKGQLLPIHQIPDDVALAVEGLDTEELFDGRGEERQQVGVARKLRLSSRVKAIELGLRHLGLLRDHVEVSGTLTLEQLVVASLQNPEAAS